MAGLFFKNTRKRLSNTITYRVAMTIDVILIVFCVLLSALYVIGNYQSFQDKSQQIILSLLSYISIFTSLLSILLALETAVKIFTEKYKIKHIIYFILLVGAVAFCILSTSIASIIEYLSEGILV